MIKEFIDAMDNDREYDFIAQHYWEMTRDDLKEILLEYIFESDDEVKENVRETLIENWELMEEE